MEECLFKEFLEGHHSAIDMNGFFCVDFIWNSFSEIDLLFLSS